MDLIQVLTATLSPDANIRQQAEAALAECSKHEGFCLNLIALIQDPNATAVNQLAAVILRRHIKHHWEVEDPTMVQITDAEKAQVRALLPNSIAEPNGKIQTAVGMAIAEIGKTDCPHAWPELLPGLVAAISNKTNANLVHGAVRCLALLVEDLSEEQVVEIAPVVLPELLNIVQNQSHAPNMRRWGLIIFHTCLGALELVYKQSPQASVVLQQSLQPWLQVITAILSAPTTEESPTDWGIQCEALGCLVRLTRSFSKVALPYLPPVLSSCWNMYVNCAPLYDKLVVRSEGDDAGIEDDSSLEKVSFSDLISQLFELLLTLLGNKKLQPMLRPAFHQLAYLCIGYMQASEGNIDKWNADVNEYLSNEDDFWGTRASGELLLDEMLESGGSDGLNAVGEAVQKRMQEAAAARQAGNDYWWRMKEAALLAAGAISDRTVSMRKKNKAMPPAIDPLVATTAILNEELAVTGNANPPFVVGRALWLMNKWSPALTPELRSAVLKVAAPALAPGNPPLVQAGACQAVARLLKRATPEDIVAVYEPAFAGLAQLMPTLQEDSLHLGIETLTALVKADAAGAARWSQHLIPGALKSWVDNVTDPLVGEDAEELLRALAANSGCLPALQTTAVPTLVDVVANPQPHSTVLIAGCLDMLTLVLQPSSVEAAAAISAAALQPVLRLLSATDDDEIAASATSFLKTTLQIGGAAALAWGGQDPATGLTTYLQAIYHLLRPEAGDSACRSVGGLIIELLRHVGPQLGPQLGDLLVAVARKVRTVEDPLSVQSLLSVLASIARSDASQLVDLLSKIDGSAGDNSSALHVAMQKWTERHMEIRTPYDIKLSITALGAILVCPHPALDTVIVRGKRIDTGAGIRTRSSKQVEQWSQVPLRVKLVMLLADSYIEAKTQGNNMGGMGNEEDEEEEYDFEDDEDEDEEFEDDSDDDAGGAGGIWNEFGMLKSLIDGDDDDYDYMLTNVDPLEEARRKTDPLNAVDVSQYVSGAFKELAQSSPALMQAAAAELTPTQVEAVQRIWQA